MSSGASPDCNDTLSNPSPNFDTYSDRISYPQLFSWFPHTIRANTTRAEICLLCTAIFGNTITGIAMSAEASAGPSCIAPHSSARVRFNAGNSSEPSLIHFRWGLTSTCNPLLELDRVLHIERDFICSKVTHCTQVQEFQTCGTMWTVVRTYSGVSPQWP